MKYNHWLFKAICKSSLLTFPKWQELLHLLLSFHFNIHTHIKTMDFCVIMAQNKIWKILYSSYKCFDNLHSNAALLSWKCEKVRLPHCFVSTALHSVLMKHRLGAFSCAFAQQQNSMLFNTLIYCTYNQNMTGKTDQWNAILFTVQYNIHLQASNKPKDIIYNFAVRCNTNVVIRIYLLQLVSTQINIVHKCIRHAYHDLASDSETIKI